MFESIIRFSLRNKMMVMFLVLGLVTAGLWSLNKIPIDAVPDITNNQVQIVTVSPSLAPQEVEQLITFPIEVSMANVPSVQEIRSVSKFGLSVVTLVFPDDMDILNARQHVTEVLTHAAEDIPKGLGSPELMPISTGLGEIYQYTLQVSPGYVGQYSIMELRTLQDWMVKRQLSGIPGIVEISSFGGKLKQYEVAVDIQKLNDLRLTLKQVFDALEKNNENIGGSYIEKGENAFYIRTEGFIQNLEDIQNIAIETRENTPILMREVADISFGSAPRYGAMTADGKGETVGGITMMFKGENSFSVVKKVNERVAEIQKSLPEGITIEPYLDRSVLVDKTINTVTQNLLEGGIIVILVLMLMLGNFRASLIVASVIPLAMLFALWMMNLFGVSANLMSLGAIDFGIVIDGAVIIVEGALFVLYTQHKGQNLSKKVFDKIIEDSSAKIYGSAAFGVLIILIVFFPLFTLEGIEGKMFIPMAQTVTFALVGALLLSLTYVPVVSSWVLKRNIPEEGEKKIKWLQKLTKSYESRLQKVLVKPRLYLAGTALVLIASGVMLSQMGAEFLPQLDEGDVALQMTIPAGSSLSQSIATTTKIEKVLMSHFPEVIHVVSKIGTAEVPTDPMSMENADIMVLLKPKDEWTTVDTKAELIEKMEAALSEIPAVAFEFTQPIQLRFNELITGSKSDISVKIYGDDLNVLSELGLEAENLIKDLPGANDVRLQQTQGLIQWVYKIDRKAIARYDLSIEEANSLIQTALAGKKAGVVFEKERRFDLVVRLNQRDRNLLNTRTLYVQNSKNQMIPLSEIVTKHEVEGPAEIRRDNTRRRVSVGVNVRGASLTDVVKNIQSTIDEKMDFPPGYTIEMGGEFENFERAKNKLLIVVPLALLLIFGILYFTFSSSAQALLILSAVPLAFIGGIASLLIRNMPFSISAGIGFIALFGVAVLNGVVLISTFNHLKKDGLKDSLSIVIKGTQIRLRPVLLTAVTDVLGFLPMAISTSAGAEVQKPLATVVIGGLISSTLLTLFMVPLIYYLMERKRKIKVPKAALSVVVLLGISLGATGQQQSLSLDTALAMASNNNLTLQNAQLDVEISKRESGQSIQLGNTDFSASYGQMNGPEQDLYWQVEQNLGSILTHVRRSESAQLKEQRAEAHEVLTAKSIDFLVRKAYDQWTFRYFRSTLLKGMIDSLESFNSSISLRRETGDISGMEAQAFEAKLGELKHKYVLELNELSQAYKDLSVLLYTQNKYTPNLEEYLPVTLESLNDSLSQSILMPLKSEFLVAQKESAITGGDFFPEVKVGYFQQDLNNISGFSGLTFGVSMPLWFLPKTKKMGQQKIEAEKAKNRYLESELQKKQELATLKTELQRLSDQLTTYGSYAKTTGNSLQKIAFLNLREGEADLFDVFNSLKSALDFSWSYLEVVHTYNQNAIAYNFLTK